MGTASVFPCLDARQDHSLAFGPHEHIEAQAELTPDAPALEMGAKQVSYSELNRSSNRLAHFLRGRGIGPGSVAGVHLDRSFESVVSFLALLKCGATYLPLDPMFPKDRLEFMVEDSGLSVLLTHSFRQGSMPRGSASVVLLDREEVSIGSFPETNLELCGDPNGLAYLIYTSGSTGKPKGVMVPRRALSNFLLSMLERPGLNRCDTLLAVTPTSFDISILELLLPLMCGARIVIATGEQAADARALEQLLRQHEITVMQATPATWRMLVDGGWEGKSDLRVLCGGEALTADLAAQLLPRCRELWNMYGPTETTIWSSCERIVAADRISLGTPIANTQLHVLDENRRPVAAGVPGELWIGGAGLALGYFKRPELSAEKFVPDFTLAGESSDARLYRTGDEVRYRNDGSIEFLGRLDHQVKLNGFRIELGEVEAALSKIEGIAQTVVILREDRPGEKRLVAYYTGRESLSVTALVQSLKRTLPDYMVPSAFVHLQRFPLTPNAKLDRKALPRPEGKRPVLAQAFIAPRTEVEKQLSNLWRDLLQLEEVGIDDNFFDLGGNSLAVVRMVSQYQARFGHEVPTVKVFQHPTIAKLAGFLEKRESDADFLVQAQSHARRQRISGDDRDTAVDGVAIIGMSGRFPGASNIAQLWSNLRNGVESISFFAPEELGPGIDEQLRNDPDYIRARGVIEGADLFDAAFFGISPLEARVMDPQQRVFLELAQQALDDAGYDPARSKEVIGVFAGIGDNHYYTTNLLSHPDLLAMAGKLAVEYGNQKDYIALRTAYLLDLRGPAISLNTACSTTLLAVDQAYRSLLDYECDIALSGGIDITVPQKSGFLYQKGGTFAKDGHCRPFDAEATGTMFCDGAGVVVLKRLADAMADGDMIYSVIRGTGKNNNGARPASFLAPSVDGQADAVALAQANANVPIESIRYIEAHGTGTPVGDPIEFEALRKVFESKTAKKQFCYIGSIKGNIGHSTNAAGVAGLIKASLVLHHEEIPPTLHFKTPNAKIDFLNSPFMMADRLIPFPRGGEVRRAAVSSFGFGGTNVHVILEEAPAQRPASATRPRQLLLLSAKSQAALDAYSHSMGEHFASASPESFADAAHTLQTGRKQMAFRRFVVAADFAEARKLLGQPNPLRCGSKRCERRDPSIVFLFGGQGTQYVNMGLNLYRDEPLFRAVVDDCCEILKPHLGLDLRETIYPKSGNEEAAQIALQDTLFTQPSIFVIEYALARFWQRLGIEPATMAGHSVGEFVAATLAGVWDLEDVLGIIALRGRLMQNLPRGSMMAVSAGVDRIAELLPAALQIASNNAPNLCVVSGPNADVEAFQEFLEAKKIGCRHLHTSHAFHSAMMDPIIEPLREAIAKIKLRAPLKPFVSTVSGRPISAAETTDPSYWAHHSRATVQFAKAVSFLKEQGYDLFLECGPRSTLCSLTRKQFTPDHPCAAIPTLADTAESDTEWGSLLFALGSLWQNGASIDWDAFYAHEHRRRIALPTYPFERQRFWVDPAPGSAVMQGTLASASAIARPASELSEDSSSCSAAIERVPIAATELSRKDRIASRVIDLLLPVSGREPSEISNSATFMEQGFDSLSLTQAAFAIGKEFSVKISFSQLMNEFPNIEMLAEHLDSTLPIEVLAEAPVVDANLPGVQALAAPAATSAVTKSSRLEEVVAEQAHTIARLVALLESTGAKPQATLVPALTGGSTPSIADPQQGFSSRYSLEVGGEHRVESTIPQRGIFASSCLCQHLSAAYNESVTLRLAGAISVEKIKRAVERLVERHDALRASFDKMGRTMKVASALTIAAPIADLTEGELSMDKSAWQEERLAKLIAEEAALPFPLPGGPLFRGQIVLLGLDRAAVVLTAHHLICDGWSLDVLIHDFCAFYSEEISDAPASLKQAQSYLEYVHDVTELQHSSDFNQAAVYWHRKFSEGFAILVLPTDHPRQARRDFKARRSARPIAASVVQDLRTLAAKEGCSFFAVLLSSLAILFARVSRQRRFVIALPSADQPVVGKPGLVGHCVNLLPFAVELHDGEAFSEFLKRVQCDLLAAQDHASFTMVSLLDDLRPGANAVGLSPISAGFTSVKRFRPNELRQSGFTVDYDTNPKAYESFEFYLNAVESEDGLELRCHYDVQLFEELTIGEWLADLDSIFKEIAASSTSGVSKLSMLEGANASAADVVLSRLSSAKSGHDEFRDDAWPGHQSAGQSANSPGSGAAPDRGPRQTALSHINPASRFQETVARSSGAGAARPTENAESVLAAWWKDLLGVEQVGLDDDFFALGGHSLTAVRLFSRISKRYGLDLELAILFEARTVRKLAAAIRKRKDPSAAEAKKWSSLVAIQPNGSRIPFFCVHALGGDVIFYEQLARALGNDQPFYAFQSPLVTRADIRETSIEKLASTYVSDLISFFPQGPYLIGGASFGGLVAFEMARQLHALGREPSLLVLFDTAVPGNERHVDVKNQIGRFRDGLLRQGAAYLKNKTLVKSKYWADNLGRRMQLVACACYKIAGRRLPLSLHYFQVGEAHKQAQMRYAFRPYAGKITLMRAVHRGPERLSKFEDSTLGWGVLAGGGLEIHDVDTRHMFMLFEPYVGTFVEQLRPILQSSLSSASLP
jgi:amino acid adenylation domain-containing protein